ncbi:MAG: hypothetical protein QXQ81_01395 [Candidatus Thorarchaeota archaeon]
MSLGERSGLVDEKERRRLIQEITHIKDVLDSFKYGLNFEEFADEIFATIDRQTVSIKSLQSSLDAIIARMNHIESRLDAISRKLGETGIPTTSAEQIPQESPRSESDASSVTADSHEPVSVDRATLMSQAEDIRAKIARLFEKENELMEMQLNDPASAEDYSKRAKVARQMREELEQQLAQIMSRLNS